MHDLCEKIGEGDDETDNEKLVTMKVTVLSKMTRVLLGEIQVHSKRE